jgi:hypothetical protein
MSTERLRTLYCALKYVVIPVEGTSFHRWIAFHQPITKNIRLIPDGYVELATPQETLAAFLEVDLGHMSAGVKIGHRTPRERCFAAE